MNSIILNSRTTEITKSMIKNLIDQAAQQLLNKWSENNGRVPYEAYAISIGTLRLLNSNITKKY